MDSVGPRNKQAGATLRHVARSADILGHLRAFPRRLGYPASSWRLIQEAVAWMALAVRCAQRREEFGRRRAYRPTWDEAATVIKWVTESLRLLDDGWIANDLRLEFAPVREALIGVIAGDAL